MSFLDVGTDGPSNERNHPSPPTLGSHGKRTPNLVALSVDDENMGHVIE
jgi:hypothetical protein